MREAEYLNDWPQRSVVLMQSSVRGMGSLCHSAALTAIFTMFECSQGELNIWTIFTLAGV